MKKFVVFLSLAVFALWSSSALAADYSKLPEVTLKVGHMSPDNVANPYHALAVYLEKHLPEKTDGKLKVQIFHSGQIGRDRELLEALQFGTLDIGIITTSPMGNFVPAFAVLDMPFIFRDWAHVKKMLDAPWMAEMLKESESAGFYTFNFIPRGFRSVTNSKVQIFTPDDMKSLKLRVIESPVFVDTFLALGASAQAMSWGEVFTALQQGTIDGQENAIMTIYDEKVYEVQKYLSLTEHIFAFTSFCASKPLFDKLPTEYQAVIKETAAEGLVTIIKEQEDQEANFLKMLEEKGMTVNQTKGKDLFRAKIDDVYAKHTKNPAVKKYFDLINAL